MFYIQGDVVDKHITVVETNIKGVSKILLKKIVKLLKEVVLQGNKTL